MGAGSADIGSTEMGSGEMGSPGSRASAETLAAAPLGATVVAAPSGITDSLRLTTWKRMREHECTIGGDWWRLVEGGRWCGMLRRGLTTCHVAVAYGHGPRGRRRQIRWGAGLTFLAPYGWDGARVCEACERPIAIKALRVAS